MSTTQKVAVIFSIISIILGIITAINNFIYYKDCKKIAETNFKQTYEEAKKSILPNVEEYDEVIITRKLIK